MHKILSKIFPSLGRSPQWRTVRKDFIAKHPKCEMCGGTKKLEVHHVKPFHLNPEMELDASNLISLCEGDKYFNCHRIFGHLNNFKLINPDVRGDVRVWAIKLKTAKGQV